MVESSGLAGSIFKKIRFPDKRRIISKSFFIKFVLFVRLEKRKFIISSNIYKCELQR